MLAEVGAEKRGKKVKLAITRYSWNHHLLCWICCGSKPNTTSNPFPLLRHERSGRKLKPRGNSFTGGITTQQSHPRGTEPITTPFTTEIPIRLHTLIGQPHSLPCSTCALSSLEGEAVSREGTAAQGDGTAASQRGQSLWHSEEPAPIPTWTLLLWPPPLSAHTPLARTALSR